MTTYTPWSAITDLPDRQHEVRAAEAAGARTYTRTVIPGPLQTPAYTRAVIADIPEVPARPDTQVEDTVTIRMERAAQLRAHPDTYQLLMSEAALHQRVGARHVMADQLVHLGRLIEELSDTTIGIIPLGAAQPVMLNDFTIYANGYVLVEVTTGELRHTDAEHRAAYTTTWEALVEAAVSGRAAWEMTHRLAGMLR